MTRVLVDTSIWVDHFRHSEPHLFQLLKDGRVVTHPMIVGEIQMGFLPRRQPTLTFLQTLPTITTAKGHEISVLIEQRKLFATKLSYIDASLLSAVVIAKQKAPIALWTRDKTLSEQSGKLAVEYSAPVE